MNWTSFFIGLLVGLIVAWLIGRTYWRGKLQSCEREKAVLEDGLDQAKGRLRKLEAVDVSLKAPKVDLPGVDLKAPEVKLPDVDLKAPEVKLPDVDLKAPEVKLPDVDLKAPEVTLPEVAVRAPRERDDLTKIEGIGPAISRLLNNAGIQTFAQLADTSTDHLWAILREAGPHFRLADPTTWPEQAGLAADGAWDKFEALVNQLKGGRRA